MQYSESEKQQIVNRHYSGESITLICAETGIARSTLYHWIKVYQPVASTEDHLYTLKECRALERKVEKLENVVKILKSVPCTVAAPLKEKLDALEVLHGVYDVYTLCEALEVSRGTFYNHILRNKRSEAWYEKHRRECKILIQQVFDETNQIFGAAKIRALLCEQGHQISAKYITELMQEMGLSSVRTKSKKEYLKLNQQPKKNILRQDFKADFPNQIWVSDITCIKMGEKYYYVCVIIDLFSRRVIAYGVSKKNSTQLVSATFRRAYEERSPQGDLVFHSDRGVQYASHSFQKLLSGHSVTQSFSASGKPHDNAVAEAFFASMKQEEIYRHDYTSEKSFRNGIENYITFYNSRRPHRTLNFKTPVQFEADAESKA